MDHIPLIDLTTFHKEIEDTIFAKFRTMVADSDFIGGKTVECFEDDFAKFCGSRTAIGVSNGTDAIALALKAAGIKPNDHVITVTNTFIATIEAILQLGAKPILVDVDINTALMDMEQVEAAITANTKAVIGVHLYGNPLNLDRLSAVCKKHGLCLIQDAAQAHGCQWNNKPIAAYGDLQTYSFYPGKNLGAWGDAGAITTNSLYLANLLKALRNHGRELSEKYLHTFVGGNYRLDPMQAIVLHTKLHYLAKKNEQRRDLYRHYTECLKDVGDIRFFTCEKGGTSVHHLFVIRTNARNKLQKYLLSKGIHCGIHYPVPLHLQPALADLGFSKGEFPHSESLAKEILSLPFFAEIQTEHIERITTEIRYFYSN